LPRVSLWSRILRVILGPVCDFGISLLPFPGIGGPVCLAVGLVRLINALMCGLSCVTWHMLLPLVAQNLSFFRWHL
jgi:hypothetical protein